MKPGARYTTSTVFEKGKNFRVEIEGLLTSPGDADTATCRSDAFYRECDDHPDAPGGRSQNPGLLARSDEVPLFSGLHEFTVARRYPAYNPDHVYTIVVDNAQGKLTLSAYPHGPPNNPVTGELKIKIVPPDAPDCGAVVGRVAAINEVRVVRVKQGAEYRVAGQSEWRTLCAGTLLKAGDELNVDPDGEVVLEFGDNTKVTVEDTTQLKIAGFFTEGGIVRTELLLKVGQVFAKVNKSETTRSDFRIKSPSATSSVRGTAFSVLADRGARTSVVSVTEGTVTVSPNAGGRNVRVGAGKEVEVKRKGAGPVVAIGRAGTPKGGISRAAAREKVLRVVARNDERCRTEVKTYSMRTITKGWRVSVRLAGGRARGTAVWKVVGRKVSAANTLARKVAHGCE